jgi:hypothetical protein
MDKSAILIILRRVSEKYSIDLEELLEFCNMFERRVETPCDFEVISCNGKKYLYDEVNNQVLTCARQKIGHICPETKAIILLNNQKTSETNTISH